MRAALFEAYSFVMQIILIGLWAVVTLVLVTGLILIGMAACPEIAWGSEGIRETLTRMDYASGWAIAGFAWLFALTFSILSLGLALSK